MSRTAPRVIRSNELVREDRRHAAQPRPKTRMPTSRGGPPAASWPRRSSGSAPTRLRRCPGAAFRPMAAPDTTYVIDNLAAAVSPAGNDAPLRGADLGKVVVHQPAAVAVVSGRIEAVGHPTEVRAAHADLPVVDARGTIAIPGLVDCHTHPAFGGNRANEFDLRSQGADYERIHAEGGGIRSTVAATRALGRDGLDAAVARHFGWMQRNGTTTAEGKSGYGLDRETELRSLAAIAKPTPDRDGCDVSGSAFGAARVRRRRRLPRLRDHRGAAGGGPDRRGGGRVSRTRRVLGRAGASISAVQPRPTAWRCGSTAISSASRARSRSQSSWGHAPSTTSKPPDRTESPSWPEAASRGWRCRSPRSTCAARCRRCAP